jgi:hypothetical protein
MAAQVSVSNCVFVLTRSFFYLDTGIYPKYRLNIASLIKVQIQSWAELLNAVVYEASHKERDFTVYGHMQLSLFPR